MTRWTGVVTLVAGAALLAGCGGGDGSEATSSGPESTTSSVAESLALTLPAASGGRCMAPNVANLQAQDTAFEGDVTEMSGGTVTLQVSKTYTGPEAETVTVRTPAQDLSGLLPSVDFQQGQTYLVSSLDGKVSLCGLSGPADELLAGLYQDAYAD